MKEKFLSWGTLVCLAVLTCLLLVHALAIFPGVPVIRWFFVTSAVVLGRLDAPAWVQAVGSIVAIFAAIGIAMWQRRNDRLSGREHAHAEATIAAVTVRSMLSPIVGTLHGMRKKNESTELDGAEARAKTVNGLLAALDIPTDAQLMALNKVLPQVAIDLAIGSGKLRHAMTAIGFVVKSGDGQKEWVLERLNSLDKFLQPAHRRFERAQRSLTAFIAQQG